MTSESSEIAFDARGLDAVLFDLDGTLIDSGEDLLDSVEHAFRSAGIEPPKRNLAKALLGAPLEEMPGELGIPMDSAAMDAFLCAFRAHYPLHWLDNTVLYGGAIELLRALRGRYRLALVTTKRQEQAENISRQLGIAKFFDCIQGFVAGLCHKPAPDILLAALDRIGVKAANAVMVGDTHRDILAGKAAGCRTIAVAWGCGAEKSLESHSPDATAKTPEALKSLLLP